MLIPIRIRSTKGIQSTRGQYGLLRATTAATASATAVTTATTVTTSGYCNFIPVCQASGYWCHSIKLRYVIFQSLLFTKVQLQTHVHYEDFLCTLKFTG